MHKNKYIDALFKTMLLSAGAHMILLAIHAIRTKEIMHLNYFNILDLEHFIPGILEIPQVHILAFVTALIVYLFFLVRK